MVPDMPFFTPAGIPAEQMTAWKRERPPPAVDAWLPGTLRTAKATAEQFRFEPAEVLTGGAMSLVYAGAIAGRRAVLKVVPDGRDGEIPYLEAARGVPQVLGVNGDRTAYLMDFVADDGQVITAVQVRDLAANLLLPPELMVGTPRIPSKRAAEQRALELQLTPLQLRDVELAGQLAETLSTTTVRNHLRSLRWRLAISFSSFREDVGR